MDQMRGMPGKASTSEFPKSPRREEAAHLTNPAMDGTEGQIIGKGKSSPFIPISQRDISVDSIIEHLKKANLDKELVKIPQQITAVIERCRNSDQDADQCDYERAHEG